MNVLKLQGAIAEVHVNNLLLAQEKRIIGKQEYYPHYDNTCCSKFVTLIFNIGSETESKVKPQITQKQESSKIDRDGA